MRTPPGCGRKSLRVDATQDPPHLDSGTRHRPVPGDAPVADNAVEPDNSVAGSSVAWPLPVRVTEHLVAVRGADPRQNPHQQRCGNPTGRQVPDGART